MDQSNTITILRTLMFSDVFMLLENIILFIILSFIFFILYLIFSFYTYLFKKFKINKDRLYSLL